MTTEELFMVLRARVATLTDPLLLLAVGTAVVLSLGHGDSWLVAVSFGLYAAKAILETTTKTSLAHTIIAQRVPPAPLVQPALGPHIIQSVAMDLTFANRQLEAGDWAAAISAHGHALSILASGGVA